MPCDLVKIPKRIMTLASLSLVLANPSQMGSQTEMQTWTTNFPSGNEGFLFPPTTNFDFSKLEDSTSFSSTTSYENEYENENENTLLSSPSFFDLKYESDPRKFDFNKDIGNPNEEYNYLDDIDITNETKLHFNESFNFTTDSSSFGDDNMTFEVTESTTGRFFLGEMNFLNIIQFFLSF